MKLLTRIPLTKNLRSFIVFAVTLAVLLSAILTEFLFYTRTSQALTEVYRGDIARQFEQINQKVSEQVLIIDSIYPQLLSNTIIRENIDPTARGYLQKTGIERRLEIERQMSYLLLSSYPWNDGLINAVYIFDGDGECSQLSIGFNNRPALARARDVFLHSDKNEPSLKIIKPDGATDRAPGGVPIETPNSVYFIRNIRSIYTGSHIAVIIIDINETAWKKSFNAGTDENWITILYNGGFLLSEPGNVSAHLTDGIKAAILENSGGTFEREFFGEDYFLASAWLDKARMTSVVAVQKRVMFAELNDALRSFLPPLIISIVIATLLFGILLSYVITSPIKRMISYVNDVSNSRQDAVKPVGMFTEFDEFAAVFSKMLDKLDVYYNDIFNQQMLLKTAELKALQAQISPHFMFNTLNTVAWKAQICGNDEIYNMVIAIGELLRANILSKDKDFVPLSEELSYVRLYIYLQRERFYDKFSEEILSDGVCGSFLVPRFCIQPLVENAISHGIEPMAGFGRLLVSVTLNESDIGDTGTGGIAVTDLKPREVTVSVMDNGVGFPEDFCIDDVRPTDEGRHTHIGLNNLNKRLIMIYGNEGALSITRENGLTAVSFKMTALRRV